MGIILRITIIRLKLPVLHRYLPFTEPTESGVGFAVHGGLRRVRMWCGGPRSCLSVTAFSSGDASIAEPSLPFHIILIETDTQISRIRLSDKTVMPLHTKEVMRRSPDDRTGPRTVFGNTKCPMGNIYGLLSPFMIPPLVCNHSVTNIWFRPALRPMHPKALPPLP
jgi:hypothetical protein